MYNDNWQLTVAKTIIQSHENRDDSIKFGVRDKTKNCPLHKRQQTFSIFEILSFRNEAEKTTIIL